jgi:UDP-GlcNAc:undecaprenyl-phosphate GlcNAc-1-phosphate transferase
MPIPLLVLLFFCSLVSVLILTPQFIKVAFKFDFLDYPQERKIHFKATPRLGGMAIFSAFIFTLLLGIYLLKIPWGNEILAILAGSIIIVFWGLLDDRFGMTPGVKMLGQLLTALVFLWLSGTSAILSGTFLDIFLFLLWIVGLLNALNFLDNMDGLCTGISLISALSFFLLGYFTNQYILVLISLSLAGGLVGFLKYNFSPAKIFLGDSGSMLNGFLLSALGILFLKEQQSRFSILIPILILSYPIFDISLVTLTRLKEGRKFYQGGKDHSSHRIVKMGVHLKRAVLSIYFICLVLGFLGISLFFWIETPYKMLLVVLVGVLLTVLGVHLNRNFSNIKEKLSLIFWDSLVINLPFLLLYWLRFKSGLFPFGELVPLSEYAIPAIWITLFWINLFAVLGLYEFFAEVRLRQHYKEIFKTVFLGLFIFFILAFSFSFFRLRPLLLLCIYGLSLTVVLCLERNILIFVERKLLVQGRKKIKTLIVGTQSNALKIKEEILANPQWGYVILGFVKESQSEKENSIPQQQIVGELSDLEDLVKEKKANQIIFAPELDWNGSLYEIMSSLSFVEVDFKIPQKLLEKARGNRIIPLSHPAFMKISPNQLRVWEWGLKRVFDLGLSLSLILLGSPILLLLWIKTNGLVKEEYSGRLGKPFFIYNFNLEKFNSTSKFWEKMAKLPFLFSILKGDLSWIGPKPQSASLYNKMNSSNYLKKLYVKPGIFCLASLRHQNSDYLKEEERLNYDLTYTEKMSLLLDLKIFFKKLFFL